MGIVERVAVGDKYNRLTVLEHKYTDAHYRKYWECSCVCGNKTITHSGSLRSGNTKSCGCLARDARARTRKPNFGSEITAVINGYKRHAISRGFEWGLSRDQVKKIIFKNCYYCDAPPGNLKVTKNSIDALKYNGIDRVNNSKGYSIYNVVPSCMKCNRAKATMSVSEFRSWLGQVGKMADQWSNL